MKAEIPAVGIMKTGDFGDAKAYKISCSCGQPDHDHDVWVEADETGVNVNVYTTQKTNFWSETFKPSYDINNPWLQEFDWFWKGLANGLIIRIKLTWTLWTKGYVTYQSTIAMSPQQALNYAETLKSAVKDVENFQKS
jgi:hypothetical protein